MCATYMISVVFLFSCFRKKYSVNYTPEAVPDMASQSCRCWLSTAVRWQV